MSQQSNSLKETFKYKVLAKLKEIPIEETLFRQLCFDEYSIPRSFWVPIYIHTYKEGVKMYSLDLHNAVKMSYKKMFFSFSECEFHLMRSFSCHIDRINRGMTVCMNLMICYVEIKSKDTSYTYSRIETRNFVYLARWRGQLMSAQLVFVCPPLLVGQTMTS